MKKSHEAGIVNEFGKKAVYLELYETKYILLSCKKFNYLKKTRDNKALMKPWGTRLGTNFDVKI